MRKWRNWQTRTFEGRVVLTIRVQVPSSAPMARGGNSRCGNLEKSRSWSSAHDWKSCNGQKPFESSNLSFSAKEKRLKIKDFEPFFFFLSNVFLSFSNKKERTCNQTDYKSFFSSQIPIASDKNCIF